MDQEQATSTHSTTALLAFFAGAALGAAVVALATPKKGRELREDITGFGRRVKGRIDHLARRSTRALEAFKETPAPRPDDLRNQASAAWQDLKEGATRAGSDLKQGIHAAAESMR